MLPDEQGNLKAVKTVRLGSDCKPLPGTEAVLECELLLIAAGFLGAQKYVSDAFGLELTPRACVKTQADGYAAGAGKIFAAGDMRRGHSLVVWAIREGRGAARAVDEYLIGYTNLT